ncbi:hypothetical protein LJR153_007389 [Paenibacillus sp. LjRoot153]|uniref:hypothetical protein n=1 Tax=Paenibacillus sp. LjRoot153 TaxID=3342270 RepID=UPI003ECC6DFB
MNVDSHQLPPIEDEKDFEHLLKDMMRVRLKNSDGVLLNGTGGQAQYSIDVFGRDRDTLEWFGVQCKVKELGKKLTIQEITKEVAGIAGFNPAISTYIIATTAKRDTKLQQAAAALSTNQMQVIVWSWEDIADILKENEYRHVLMKYYHRFFVDARLMGNTVGKVITLQVGTDGRYISGYHLFIGKTTSHDPHFKNTYIIADMFSKTMDNFPVPAFESDIESAIRNRHDRKIIVRWINSVNIEDEVIYGDEREFYYSIPHRTLLEDFAMDEDSPEDSEETDEI